MYNALKYVMFIRTETQRAETIKRQYIPVIFPEAVMHRDMAERMAEQGWTDSVHAGHTIDYAPVSAGFINMHSLSCFGESESLGLSSNALDSQIISEWPITKGIIP